MAFTIDGTTGIATVDGSVSAPSQRGQDTNSGISYAADTIKFSTGGVERMAITNSGVTGTGIGDGKIVKTSYVSTATFTDSTSTSYVDITNLTVNHTPLSASNTLHIVAHIQCLVIKTGGYEGSIGLRILKDSTEISAIELRSKNYAYSSNSNSGVRDCVTGIVDAQVSAGGTSQITFKCQMKMISGALVSINPGNEGGGTDSDQSSITIFEIAP